MFKTNKQIKEEIKQYENFLKFYEEKEEKEGLNNKDIGQLQMFCGNSIELYHRVFEGRQWGKLLELQNKFNDLSGNIKTFYTSLVQKYDLPSLNELYGAPVTVTMKTGVITHEGIVSKLDHETLVITHHKNDFIHG